jgi:vesicle-fusing ATPase
MPLDRLHMTALEVAHSLTESEIERVLQIMKPMIPKIADYPFNHRAKLVKPSLSYDTQAIALSFLPASDEAMPEALDGSANVYTYHHLRRDLYDRCKSTGVAIGSRYVAPSAHLTLARFVTKGNLVGGDQSQIPNLVGMAKWVSHLEDINTWLRDEYWPGGGSATETEGEWVVGDERGLECRVGTVWYGGGRSVSVGKSFKVSAP